MATTKLNTGVEITYDKKGNIKTLNSPYYNNQKIVQGSTLRFYVAQIKKLIA